MDNPLIATPVNGESFDTDDLTVVELGLVNKINLRGKFGTDAADSALTKLLGMECNVNANTYLSNSASTVFWLGPDERLLYTDSDPQSVIDRWCENTGVGAVDVSDYYTVLRLSGAKVRDVIASGTPFDVHPEEFKVGQCTQTRFGNASILLSNHANTPVFQLQVRWSYAEYVFDYIKRVSGYV